MLRCAVGMVAVALLSGCAADPTEGYSFESTFDPGIRTVAVRMLDNETFNPGLETQLTEAISKAIQQQTPWLITRGDKADTTLSGAITKAKIGTLARTPGTGLTQEQSFELTLDFVWRDNRTGEVIVERRNFSSVSTWVPALGTSERIELAQRDAIGELARDIVGEMRSDW